MPAQALTRAIWHEIIGTGEGKKGHETQRAHRATGGIGIYLALAFGSADPDPAFVFSAARLHIEVRGRGVEDHLAEPVKAGLPARRFSVQAFRIGSEIAQRLEVA